MKKTVLIASLFLFVFTLTVSCNKEVHTVNVGNRYSMELPPNFEAVKDINKAASLQYQNAFKQMYVIVIDEPKDVLSSALQNNGLYDSYPDNLKGYSQLITDGMDTSIGVKKMPAFNETTINGLTARELAFEGVSSGEQVYWKLAFVEGSNRYYQIMVWTRAENKDKYEKEMTSIINSFNETGKSKKR